MSRSFSQDLLAPASTGTVISSRIDLTVPQGCLQFLFIAYDADVAFTTFLIADVGYYDGTNFARFAASSAAAAGGSGMCATPNPPGKDLICVPRVALPVGNHMRLLVFWSCADG